MSNPALIPGPLSSAQLRELRDSVESGVLPENASSRALEASRIVKPFGGKLFGLSVYSSNGAAQFIQLFDANVLPDDGAIPTFVLKVEASDNLGLYFGSVGRAFEQGIVVCNSSTADTKTIGSADCWFDAQYI